MNDNLLFDFTVDKAAQKVFITREFKASQALVWDAFTKPELLDRWSAPAPMRCKTKYMNFEVGGRRFFAMINPEGQEGWLLQRYTSITPITNFKLYNSFADKDENPQLPGSEWDYTFSEENGKAKVVIVIYNESLERMERQIAMGFGAGYTVMLQNLEELLGTLSE